jgi:riboflavin kinase/FMN adenylyltransferase
MIRAGAGRYGYRAVRIGAVEQGGRVISSSRIRAALREGEVEDAAAMLGRLPDIEGIVVTGRGEGKRRLVATANLDLPSAQFLPAPGVYAGEAEWEGAWHPAVMNLGRRPTLGPEDRLIPEVHVIDLEEDLLGRRLLFRMRLRLREERKFPSIDALRRQIMADISAVRTLADRWAGKETDLPKERDPDSLPR